MVLAAVPCEGVRAFAAADEVLPWGGAEVTSISLINPVQANNALNAMYRDTIKPGTMAGQRYRLTLKPETRRDAQSAHFHAMISDIAEQIGGDLADKDNAKRILLSAFRIDTLQEFADERRKFGDLRIGRGLRGE